MSMLGVVIFLIREIEMFFSQVEVMVQFELFFFQPFTCLKAFLIL